MAGERVNLLSRQQALELGWPLHGVVGTINKYTGQRKKDESGTYIQVVSTSSCKSQTVDTVLIPEDATYYEQRHRYDYNRRVENAIRRAADYIANEGALILESQLAVEEPEDYISPDPEYEELMQVY